MNLADVTAKPQAGLHSVQDNKTSGKEPMVRSSLTCPASVELEVKDVAKTGPKCIPPPEQCSVTKLSPSSDKEVLEPQNGAQCEDVVTRERTQEVT